MRFRDISRARRSSSDKISCLSGFLSLTLSGILPGNLRIFRCRDAWWAALIWKGLIVPILYFQFMHDKILKHLIVKKGLLIWTFHMWWKCITWESFWQTTLLFLCILVLSRISLFNRPRGYNIYLLIGISLWK
jgi:hypothetical protein